MRIVGISLFVSIICVLAVGATDVYSPFTKETFVYNDDKFEITEGDIRVTKASARNGLRDPKRLWPQRIIPYKINNTFTSSERRILMRAIRSFYEKTCIRFVPAMPFHKRYVWISNGFDGCFSDVGYYATGELNQINLGEGCLRNEATPVHELLHTCGLEHEHTRVDRDEWVEVLWNNIEKKERHNFYRISAKEYSNYGVPYNYNSVMHYPLDAFGKEKNLNTMKNLKPHNGRFGYEIGWAQSDIKKLHLMYNCTALRV